MKNEEKKKKKKKRRKMNGKRIIANKVKLQKLRTSPEDKEKNENADCPLIYQITHI